MRAEAEDDEEVEVEEREVEVEEREVVEVRRELREGTFAGFGAVNLKGVRVAFADDVCLTNGDGRGAAGINRFSFWLVDIVRCLSGNTTSTIEGVVFFGELKGTAAFFEGDAAGVALTELMSFRPRADGLFEALIAFKGEHWIDSHLVGGGARSSHTS
jgi:hypothetical protein